MTLLRSLFNIKMNRTIYLILITSISFFFIFYIDPSLFRVYANLADLISGETVRYTRFGSDPSPYPVHFPRYKPLTLTFICTYLLFHSIILTLISIPRMNDCRANRWLAPLLLIPEFNYIIVLLLMLLPKAKHADQVRSSIWGDLWKAVMTFTLIIVVGFTVAVFGTLFLYAVQMTFFQKQEAITSPTIMGQD